MSRKFNPRKIIPETKLMELLKEGWTLEEIGDKYNVSRSYISELCSLFEIKTEEIEGRKYAMRKRREELKHRSFIDVMYDKIRKEAKHG